MAICSRCGCSFDLSQARHLMGVRYGAGCYDDYYPDGDVCEDCANSEIGADYAEGAEIIDLMGLGWDPD